MKKSEFYNIKENKIYFIKSGNSYPVSEFKKVDVKTKPVLKNAVATILNATVNAMTSSIGNGNEQILILVDVQFNEQNERIQMTEKPLIRGNLDYYEMVEHARKLQKAIKSDIAETLSNK